MNEAKSQLICGRGATTCLICNKDGEHVVYNNMSIIYGCKMLFDTNQVSEQFHNVSQSFHKRFLVTL